jgi:hypothetical protein
VISTRLEVGGRGRLAILLIVAGMALRRGTSSRASLLSACASGALLYTAVNSAGYYAELGDWPPVVMFGVLAVSTVVLSSRLVLGPPPAPSETATAPGARVPTGRRS